RTRVERTSRARGWRASGAEASICSGSLRPKDNSNRGAAAARRLFVLLDCRHADRRLLEPSHLEASAPEALRTVRDATSDDGDARRPKTVMRATMSDNGDARVVVDSFCSRDGKRTNTAEDSTSRSTVVGRRADHDSKGLGGRSLEMRRLEA